MRNKLQVASDVVKAWGRILGGRNPILSIEITRECPLHCPGCYAYNDEHLGGALTLRELTDKKGSDLVQGILSVVKKLKPLHVSLVGGEPMVRARELSELLPLLIQQKTHVQLVTSGVRSIPIEWASLPHLTIVVSIDGLQPEHDERRKPATYERILKNIQGQRITVHCTITRQQIRRDDYIDDFLNFWSANENVEKIWMSLYTPQKGEVSEEQLTKEDRARVVEKLLQLRKTIPKLDMPDGLVKVYLNPPKTPDKCIFASTSTCISADLEKRITPCQFGGNPDCENCGCVASAAMEAIGRQPIKFGFRVGHIFTYSQKVGAFVNGMRKN